MRGACLCGAVTFTGRLMPAPAGACHCSHCRRCSGHFGAGAEVRDPLIQDKPRRWLRSSDEAARGFFATCGAPLFWREIGFRHRVVLAGAVTPPRGLRLEGQIHAANKGHYDGIAGGLPRQARS